MYAKDEGQHFSTFDDVSLTYLARYSEGFNESISEYVEYDEYRLKYFYGRIEISTCREYSQLLFQS